MTDKPNLRSKLIKAIVIREILKEYEMLEDNLREFENADWKGDFLTKTSYQAVPISIIRDRVKQLNNQLKDLEVK